MSADCITYNLSAGNPRRRTYVLPDTSRSLAHFPVEATSDGKARFMHVRTATILPETSRLVLDLFKITKQGYVKLESHTVTVVIKRDVRWTEVHDQILDRIIDHLGCASVRIKCAGSR